MSEDGEGESSSSPVYTDLEVSWGTFRSAQMKDPILKTDFEQVTMVDGVSQLPGTEKKVSPLCGPW